MKYCSALIAFFLPAIGLADPAADEILERVKSRDDGRSYVTTVILRNVSDDGNVRDRNMYMIQKDFPKGEERALMYFHSPADVRDVSFLIANYNEVSGQPDDQWMYLPAFRKTRRIGSNDKRGSFMGSEFNYSDLDKVRVSDYESQIAGETELFDRPAWIIERAPVSQEIINKTGYHKVKVWIDKERDIQLQTHYFNEKDILFKTQQSTDIKQVDGIWTIMESKVENLETGVSSKMIFTNIAYNVDVPDNKLNEAGMKRGIRDNELPEFNNTKVVEN